MSVGK
jgi:hypothetical protein